MVIHGSSHSNLFLPIIHKHCGSSVSLPKFGYVSMFSLIHSGWNKLVPHVLIYIFLVTKIVSQFYWLTDYPYFVKYLLIC